ncbi:hypothetical protein F8M41_025373 [Gigaspora margarita]|uniref:Uncharacterized protein n=1 Tax=Gigaspora margarita TaxID=4874 RepID=A0A8H3XIN0_GIGMA|nr:hypothetical protein F8M41_025373 [Gigaspora margarita]
MLTGRMVLEVMMKGMDNKGDARKAFNNYQRSYIMELMIFVIHEIGDCLRTEKVVETDGYRTFIHSQGMTLVTKRLGGI